jgi:adenosylmethionine-8-amino-7-oxononanoate aminotransferase
MREFTPKANDDSQVLHRKTEDFPQTVHSAKGIYLTLSSGRQVIDESGGAAVTCLGHGRVDIAEAIQKQMLNVAHTYVGSNLTSQVAEDLAQLLLEGAYSGRSKAFFCSSGSEATEAALKLALQFWQEKGAKTRTNFVARHQSYHGNTLGALSVSGAPGRRKNYASWMSKHVTFVKSCSTYRGMKTGESNQDYVERLVADLDQTFQEICTHKVAGFIIETVGGSTTGCATPPKGYLKAVAKICRKYGILLILDEVSGAQLYFPSIGALFSLSRSLCPYPFLILYGYPYRKPPYHSIDILQIMCGMGRTGTLHAWQMDDFEGPDIQTIGKSLGGGYIPISAVLVSSKIVETVSSGSGRVAHSHTFQVLISSVPIALAKRSYRHIRWRVLLLSPSKRQSNWSICSIMLNLWENILVLNFAAPYLA